MHQKLTFYEFVLRHPNPTSVHDPEKDIPDCHLLELLLTSVRDLYHLI